VKGDTTVEPEETFTVNVYSTSGAAAVRTSGLGTIIDDDAMADGIGIGDVTVFEGNAGTAATARFTVRLSAPFGSTITVDAATVAGSAHAGSDFVPLSSTVVTIPGGKVSATVTVSIKGDIVIEPNETFTVVLSNNNLWSINRGTGTGTIRDDDPVFGQLPCGADLGGVRC
jgi:hypothetical protein